jgi:hypothetical protein
LEGKEAIEEIFEQNMDKLYTDTDEKLEINKEISDLTDELNKTLTDEQKKLLDEINQKEDEKRDIINKNTFVFAYSLAVKSIIQSLK